MFLSGLKKEEEEEEDLMACDNYIKFQFNL